ncbi:hypothetical protein N431DRAFT_494753 [Stipitochalara longipes BDJ]|nr:hypothetical protein N431DRAFT_494753 [Stipitochalara longipes BDJ]
MRYTAIFVVLAATALRSYTVWAWPQTNCPAGQTCAVYLDCPCNLVCCTIETVDPDDDSNVTFSQGTCVDPANVCCTDGTNGQTCDH